jgi:hypothetical protein
MKYYTVISFCIVFASICNEMNENGEEDERSRSGQGHNTLCCDRATGINQQLVSALN